MPDQQSLIPFAREIVDVPVGDEMSESFLAYSLSVITSRAIPDIRDGLKPVQRRILYTMLQLGMRPDTPHRKSARVVGDTMGRYHPHGDSAIYETLVRMGQDFARGLTLVHPQGNFGSLDDPPAAARYTECRLTDAAMDMVRELDEDTVDFRPTYDGEGEEPECLPALIPNLIVNGTSGIAVGMATNMPTHNLREAYAAIELVMNQRRPRPTIDELLQRLPGPDFPSGGIIVDDGLREAYETGRGSFRIRARCEIEQLTRQRQGIVVTELPYMVGPEKVIARITELMNLGKLTGVTEVKNLSDRTNGMRIQIECRSGVNPQAVLAELHRSTPMEETFGINNVVLVGGVPTTVGLFDLCRHYIDHRLDVVVRRTRYRLGRARDRLHIVEGLVIALDAIDEVVAIIRSSQDAAEARGRLMESLDLSDIQATHILDMMLRRLTALEKQKLIDERDDLLERIAGYETLLGSERRQRTLVLSELAEAVEAYGVDRRSEIVSADELPVIEPHVPVDVADVTDEPCVITLSTSGMLGRAPAEGATRALAGRHDVLVATTAGSTTSTVFAITSEGRVLSAAALELGEIAGRSRGSAASTVFGTNRGEEIRTVVVPGDEPLVLVTTGGIVKRVAPDELATTKTGGTIIKLKNDDRVAAAFTSPDGVDIVLVASDAQALRTPVDGVSIQGRSAGGVAGMKLRAGSSVVGAGVLGDDAVVVTVTDRGAVKATEAAEIPAKGRGGQGVRLTRFTDDRALTLAWAGELDGLLVFMSTDDDAGKLDPNPVAFPAEPTRRDLVSTATERPVLALGRSRW